MVLRWCCISPVGTGAAFQCLLPSSTPPLVLISWWVVSCSYALRVPPAWGSGSLMDSGCLPPEHLVMPPSEPTLCQCCFAPRQNMLEWGIDGPAEVTGFLYSKPLVEVFRAREGVACCPDEETEPSLWQFPELCPADCSARDTLPSCPLPLLPLCHRPHSELLMLNPGDLCNNKVLPLLPACLGP